LGLAEHIFNILTEAEHRTVGDLMMAIKLKPDSILGLAGIGPKSLEAIKAALGTISFPEPQPKIEPLVEIPLLNVVETPIETIPAIAPSEALPDTVLSDAEQVSAVSGTGEEIETLKPLEEIFTLRSDMLQPVVVPSEDDEDESEKKKEKEKEKKKKKKVVEIVYDEDLEKAIAKKKHKRGDEGWEED
jgi:hypothetical protein